jgi:hypothetical protein
MKPKIYNLLSLAVEEGVRAGYRRAYKHDDNPLESMVINTLHHEVMVAISDYFEFDEP